MFFVALATDYDGTLAQHGSVDDRTCKALEEVRASGRKLIMVTGRDLPDLERVFERFDLFDLIVAENGALLKVCIYLRKQKSLVASPLETDAEDKAGVPRIEVTPEMIEAGLVELAGFDWQECPDSASDVVRRIWFAMARSANQTSERTR